MVKVEKKVRKKKEKIEKAGVVYKDVELVVPLIEEINDHTRAYVKWDSKRKHIKA